MEQENKKVCQHCNTEFEPKNIGSFEQKYCSQKCRYTANNKIRAAKILNYQNRLTNVEQHIPTTTSGINFNQAQQRHTDIPIFGTASDSNFSPYSLLEKRYDAKIEAMEFKLKCEELERRNTQLQQENVRLQLRIEEYQNEEEEEEIGGGILGEILQNDMVKQALPLVLAKILK